MRGCRVGEREEPGGRPRAQGNDGAMRKSSPEDTHQEHCRVLPSLGANPGGVGEVQPGDRGGRVYLAGVRAELPASQVDHVTTARDHPQGEGRDMREQEANRASKAGEHCRRGKSLQPHRGVWQRPPSNEERHHGVRDQVEVTPRTHTNELLAEYNGTDVFIDPISFVIKAAATPVRCNDIAPPRWRLNRQWYCAYPQIRDCGEPGRIPIKPVNIDDVGVMNLGLGRSIYSPEQLEEFKGFQESQGTRRAFLTDSAECAYNSRVGGEWGSGLTGPATDSLIDAVGNYLVPMYRVIGPTAAVALLILFLVGVIRMLADIVIRAIAIAEVRGCGWWLIGAFWWHAVSHGCSTSAVGHGERPHCQQDHRPPDGCRSRQSRRTRPRGSKAQPGGAKPTISAQRAAQQPGQAGELVAWIPQQESRRLHLLCTTRPRDARRRRRRSREPRGDVRERQRWTRIQPVSKTSAPSPSGECAAYIGIGGMRIEKEPRQ